jgi:hypothetical protein
MPKTRPKIRSNFFFTTFISGFVTSLGGKVPKIDELAGFVPSLLKDTDTSYDFADRPSRMNWLRRMDSPEKMVMYMQGTVKYVVVQISIVLDRERFGLDGTPSPDWLREYSFWWKWDEI